MSSFQLNLNPLKEPLGFIKVLELVSAARSGEAGNRASAPAPAATTAGPAPSAGRWRGRGGAPGSQTPPRPGGPLSCRRPRDGAGRVGTARTGRGRWPRPGPARGGDDAVATNHGCLGCVRPGEAALPHPSSPRCPGGSGASNFSLASLLPAREEKTSCCGLTETRRTEVALRPAVPLYPGGKGQPVCCCPGLT